MKKLIIYSLFIAIIAMSCSNNQNNESVKTVQADTMPKFPSTGYIDIKGGDGKKYIVKYRIEDRAMPFMNKERLNCIRDLCDLHSKLRTEFVPTLRPDTSLEYVFEIRIANNNNMSAFYSFVSNNMYNVPKSHCINIYSAKSTKENACDSLVDIIAPEL